MKFLLFLMILYVHSYAYVTTSDLSWKKIIDKIQKKQFKRVSHEAEVNELFQTHDSSINLGLGMETVVQDLSECQRRLHEKCGIVFSPPDNSPIDQEGMARMSSSLQTCQTSMESCNEKFRPESLQKLKSLFQQSELFIFVIFELFLFLLFLYFMVKLFQTLKNKTSSRSDQENAVNL